MSSRSLRVRRVNSLERLQALETEWWRLYSRSRAAEPFQSPAWLCPWAELFGSGCALEAVALLSEPENALVGLMPLASFLENGVRVVRWVGSGITDYGDALIAAGYEAEAVTAFANALLTLLDEHDRIELGDVPEDSPLRALRHASLRVRDEPGEVCPRIELSHPFEALLDGMPAWQRRNVRQGEARLARLGTASWETADAQTLTRHLDAFFALHGARWQARGQSGVLHDESVREFHRRAAARLLERGLLELSVLSVDGRPAAVTYVLNGSDAALYLTGFDPTFQRLNVGSVAIARAIRRASESRRTHFDFLRGAEPYKYSWGARDSVTVRLTLGASGTPRAAAQGFHDVLSAR